MRLLREIFSNVNDDAPPNFGAEDFAYYLEEVTGVFILLGIRNPEKNIVDINHSNRFDIDEGVLPVGVEIFVTLAVDFLKNCDEYIDNCR